jgi:hypothetical protein
VKTENPSACVTVNCKLCKPAIALYSLQLRETVTEMPVNPIIRSRTRYFRYAYPPTRDSKVKEQEKLRSTVCTEALRSMGQKRTHLKILITLICAKQLHSFKQTFTSSYTLEEKC